MFTWKCRYIESNTSKFNDDNLSNSNEENNEQKHQVIENSNENILLIIDFSSIKQVEDLKPNKNIENVCELSAWAIIFLNF
jgi:DeoR/GlpR family transcriptional regulator of sugar metabolism